MELTHAGASGQTLSYYPPHRHKGWELIYNLTGSGTMVIDGATYSFGPGSILLCPPGVVHTKSSEGGFEDCYLGISGWDLPPKVYTLEDDRRQRIAQLLRVLILTWREGSARAVCQDLLRAILGLLQPSLSGDSGNRHVQLLRLRLLEHFNDPALRLQDLQADIPVNGDYLRRLFRQEHGVAPHEYLTRLRLDHAAHLLRYEGVSVSEAAFRSGFYDPLYFSRIFHRHFGLAPSHWRTRTD